MKHSSLATITLAAAAICGAADKSALPVGMPDRVQARVNDQRRFALAGLERFAVSTNFILPDDFSRGRNLEASLLRHVVAILREGEIRTLAVEDVRDDWTKTGQLICSVVYSPVDTLMEITIEVSADMTNPRTSKTDTVVIWRHSEAENVRGPKGIPIDKLSAALRLFIIDYTTASRSFRR